MECSISLAIKIIILVFNWHIVSCFPNSRNNFFSLSTTPFPDTTNNNRQKSTSSILIPSTKILPPLGPNIFANILSNNQKFPTVNSKFDEHYLNDKSSAGAYYHNPFLPNIDGQPSNDNNNNFAEEIPTHLVPIQDPWESNIPSLPIETDNLSLADWHNYNLRDPNGPGTYAWGYDIEDPFTGNVQFRNEEKHSNGSVIGSYGYLEPDGNVRITHYIADKLGYRARMENGRYKPLKFPFEGVSNKIEPQLTATIQTGRKQSSDKFNHLKKFNLFFIPK